MCDFKSQCAVSKYRVDAYSKKFNIILECDEDDHKQYDKAKDVERTRAINQLLDDPSWIRFNPKDDIFEVIGRISMLVVK
jgi:very-short-patch-repair endonuclease